HRVPLVKSPSFVEALSFAFFSKKLLQEESFDIIHSFERTFYQDIYRAGDGCHREWLIQRGKMDPWVKRWTYRMNPLHSTYLFLEKRLFQSPRLKRIIANSQRGKEEIIHHYGVPDEKIEVIYNGVDLEAFHPRNVALFRKALRKELKIPQETLAILFLGSGFRRKGLDRLIASFPRIKKEIPQAVLIVAGKDGIHRYREMAKSLGVERNILFLGPTQRAKELYAASDLFVLPTIYDPFSNACLEALATGIPVLTTRTNGIAELIIDRQNGFLIQDPMNSGEISEKILAFFASAEKTPLKEEARKTTLPLDLASVLNRMIHLYEELKG
ncbi:MAG TPA: glycosyltransferase family 4 protein, partial [Thermodesulfobacteriota bacterium]|nr:glycosyltransferase family 4 protein [Thermodesulfobacteriota bacterium]